MFIANILTELLVTVSNAAGIAILALAGIWLSWSTKYIKKILGNVVLWWPLEIKEGRRRINDPTETSPLIPHAPKRPEKLYKIIKDESGIRQLLYDVLTVDGLALNDRLLLFLFTLVVAACAGVIIFGSYYVSNIRPDGPAILDSDQCGLWLFDGEKASDAATRAGLLDLAKEERAAEFAKDCYRSRPNLDPSCRTFYRPILPLSGAIWSADCPFVNDICHRNETVSFVTKLVNAQDIGINAASTLQFRRKTSCTPLSMGPEFIKNTTVNDTTTFTYHYGSKYDEMDRIQSEYTYSTTGDPWDRLAPVYDLFAYSYTANDYNKQRWRPHAKLTIPDYSTLTIIFVSSLRILYQGRSEDPIFPADQEWQLPGDYKMWFKNSDPRARPLACIDTIEICETEHGPCKNVNAPEGDDTAGEETPVWELLYASLIKTDTYYSVAKRQGRALLAQKKVSQYFSIPLGDTHWVAEVENFVQTGLARTTINAWSVARGEDAVHEGQDGFTKRTQEDLCRLYKYKPQGYQTIDFMPLLVVALFLPITWILSWDWGSVLMRYEQCQGQLRNLNLRIAHWRISRHSWEQDNSGSERGESSSRPASIQERPTSSVSTRPTQSTPPPTSHSTAQVEHSDPSQASRAGSLPLSKSLVEWEPIVFSKLLYLIWRIPLWISWDLPISVCRLLHLFWTFLRSIYS